MSNIYPNERKLISDCEMFGIGNSMITVSTINEYEVCKDHIWIMGTPQ
jgi:CRISPR/Cas system-associated exonuclease Cas4 (RecB family)